MLALKSISMVALASVATNNVSAVQLTTGPRQASRPTPNRPASPVPSQPARAPAAVDEASEQGATEAAPQPAEGASPVQDGATPAQAAAVPAPTAQPTQPAQPQAGNATPVATPVAVAQPVAAVAPQQVQQAQVVGQAQTQPSGTTVTAVPTAPATATAVVVPIAEKKNIHGNVINKDGDADKDGNKKHEPTNLPYSFTFTANRRNAGSKSGFGVTSFLTEGKAEFKDDGYFYYTEDDKIYKAKINDLTFEEFKLRNVPALKKLISTPAVRITARPHFYVKKQTFLSGRNAEMYNKSDKKVLELAYIKIEQEPALKVTQTEDEETEKKSYDFVNYAAPTQPDSGPAVTFRKNARTVKTAYNNLEKQAERKKSEEWGNPLSSNSSSSSDSTCTESECFDSDCGCGESCACGENSTGCCVMWGVFGGIASIAGFVLISTLFTGANSFDYDEDDFPRDRSVEKKKHE